MALRIMHTGQTGVEAGARRAAQEFDVAVGGYCTPTARNEFGPLSAEVARELIPAANTGARSAARQTMAGSDGLVLVVPIRTHAMTEVGVESILREARRASKPAWIVDPMSDVDDVYRAIRTLIGSASEFKLMVTGPRMTRWDKGERAGWGFVARLLAD